MKAVCFSASALGGVEALSVKTIPKPFVETPTEVLIQVHAASFNPIDKLRLKGDLALLMPETTDTCVIGYDVSGVVTEVGSSVKDYAAGDEVFVRLKGMKHGALAEYVVCEPFELAKKPKGISHVQAAAVPLAGLTALQALRKGGVTKGSKVFIPAGSGGVGSIAIQIAKKLFGASHVTTTASPGKGTEICEAAGADEVINYREVKFHKALEGEGYDMAFDTTNEAALMGGILKEGGKIVSIGGTPTTEGVTAAFGAPPPMILRFFLWLGRNSAAEQSAAAAGGSWEYMFMQPSGSDLAELAKLLEDGSIKPFIDTEAASLDEYAAAAEKLFSGRAKGKCVVKVV
jgi:alcohol dehydrogenase